MSVDDFCQCTPPEFQAVHDGWAEARQRRERAAWERTRMQCTCMLQPYSKHRLEPRNVMQFDWDPSTGSGTGDHVADASKKAEQLTAKEIWERFEEVKREMGLE